MKDFSLSQGRGSQECHPHDQQGENDLLSHTILPTEFNPKICQATNEPTPPLIITNPSFFSRENASATTVWLTLKFWPIFSRNNLFPFFNLPERIICFTWLYIRSEPRLLLSFWGKICLRTLSGTLPLDFLISSCLHLAIHI
jgi:hypothetical protein